MTICYSGNYLLYALTAACPALRQRVRQVDMPAGKILQGGGDPVSVLYFPGDALLSVQQLLADGYGIEIGSVGSEGMTGVASCLQALDASAAQVVVGLAGNGFQLEIGWVREALDHSRALHALLMRYAYSTMIQLGHLHACAGHHNVTQRVCCWLLHATQRLGCDDLHMTQDELGNILGVRRESVSQVLGCLRELGVLHTQRAALRVVDRAQLRLHACECHGLLHAEHVQLRDYLAASAMLAARWRRLPAAPRRNALCPGAGAGACRRAPVHTAPEPQPKGASRPLVSDCGHCAVCMAAG